MKRFVPRCFRHIIDACSRAAILVMCVCIPACGGPAIGPLNLAAQEGDVQTVRRLLNEGADVNRITNDISPLRAASCRGQVGIVKLLLAYGADPNTPNDKPITGLGCASLYGHDEVAKALIRAGARINAAFGERGATALILASKRGSTSLVKMLLESNANPNQTDVWGGSALHQAAYVGNSDIARMLVEAGANTTIRLSGTPENSKDAFAGDAPLAIAKRKGFTAIVEYLQRQGSAE